ncbi:hypothetical protein HYH03_014991 [Edaphochlamys debaryana]|uniref:Protein kinase domain-containing protein n=1 Tax=Edaphochlamys debaryana TaxID=47281 RepID=A0A835XLY8_9CHLO|nr:hypothetical protein HYH03_014991 [Edaphochlamys debaryana]|eukprot:KAG2486286.1 hypothetical protein HYH03_014991 [Edaphochlamys debaryana]
MRLNLLCCLSPSLCDAVETEGQNSLLGSSAGSASRSADSAQRGLGSAEARAGPCLAEPAADGSGTISASSGRSSARIGASEGRDTTTASLERHVPAGTAVAATATITAAVSSSGAAGASVAAGRGEDTCGGGGGRGLASAWIMRMTSSRGVRGGGSGGGDGRCLSGGAALDSGAGAVPSHPPCEGVAGGLSGNQRVSRGNPTGGACRSRPSRTLAPLGDAGQGGPLPSAFAPVSSVPFPTELFTVTEPSMTVPAGLCRPPGRPFVCLEALSMSNPGGGAGGGNGGCVGCDRGLHLLDLDLDLHLESNPDLDPELRPGLQAALRTADGDDEGGGGGGGGGTTCMAGLLTLLQTAPSHQLAEALAAAGVAAPPPPGMGRPPSAAAAVVPGVARAAPAVAGGADDRASGGDGSGGGGGGGGGSFGVLRSGMEALVASTWSGLAVTLHHERGEAAARFCSESAADDVEGLALTQLEAFDAAAGAATFRATAPASGLPCAVKLTELPYGSAAAVRALLLAAGSAGVPAMRNGSRRAYGPETPGDETSTAGSRSVASSTGEGGPGSLALGHVLFSSHASSFTNEVAAAAATDEQSRGPDSNCNSPSGCGDVAGIRSRSRSRTRSRFRTRSLASHSQPSHPASRLTWSADGAADGGAAASFELGSDDDESCFSLTIHLPPSQPSGATAAAAEPPPPPPVQPPPVQPQWSAVAEAKAAAEARGGFGAGDGPLPVEAEAAREGRCALRAAAEVALLCSLSHPNIVQVCAWHCGVCMDPGPPAGSGGGGSGAGSTEGGGGGADGSGGGPLLTLRLATDADFDADPPAAAATNAPSPVCVALVTDCDLGSLQTALTAGWPHGGGSGGSGTAGPEPAAEGGTNWQAVLRTLLDVACALRYLHAHRIAHTRVRPSAVQLRALPRTADPRGFTAKLADFAFAHHCGRPLPSAAAAALAATAAGSGTSGDGTAAAGAGVPPAVAPWLVATAAEGQAGSEGPEHEGLPLECLPPEGYRGAAPSPAWDVWCLGFLIWACAHGPRHPLSALPPADLPAALCGGWRPAFGPRVPPALAALAANCWAPDPRQRPAAAAVVTRLRGLLRAEAVVGGGVGGGAA